MSLATRNLRRYIRDESGTALLASVLFVVLITGAGMATVMATSVNQNASNNVLTSKQAFYLAEAGLQHGKTFLTQNQSNWTTYASVTAQTLLPYTSLASTGGYRVTVQDGGGGSLLIRSTGTASGNAQTVVQSLATRINTAYTPRYAFMTGKDINMNVNASIQGTSGGVHANGELYIENSPTINTDATASGLYSLPYGTPTVGGASGGGTPLEPIPAIRPSDFYAYRDYLLASDGKVYDKNGVYVGSGAGGKGWYGWQYLASKQQWSIAGGKIWTICNNYLNGTFYVEGNAEISGDFNNSAWDATVIATGSINVDSKNINIKPPAPNGTFCNGSTTYHPETKDILFLAGGDIYISPPSNGKAQTFKGLIAAHEQIAVKGYSTTTINGALLAEDAATTSRVVEGDDYLGYCRCSATTGAMKIIYNGAADISNPTLQGGTGGTGTVNIMTWQVMQ
jgi:Tfp pilus assembly protein PilX